MAMKNLLLTLLAIVLSELTLFAQEDATVKSFEPIDLDTIEQIAKNKKSYRALVKRFEHMDSTLTKNEYAAIYFGAAYQKGYTGGYGKNSELFRLFKENKYEALYKICPKKLSKNPANIRATRYMMMAVIDLKGENSDEFDLYLHRFCKLLATIARSGKGTEESPWMVIAVDDEYELMRYHLEAQDKKAQALVNCNGKPCDKIEFEKCMLPGVTQVYFDVSLPLSAYSKTFK